MRSSADKYKNADAENETMTMAGAGAGDVDVPQSEEVKIKREDVEQDDTEVHIDRNNDKENADTTSTTTTNSSKAPTNAQVLTLVNSLYRKVDKSTMTVGGIYKLVETHYGWDKMKKNDPLKYLIKKRLGDLHSVEQEQQRLGVSLFDSDSNNENENGIVDQEGHHPTSLFSGGNNEVEDQAQNLCHTIDKLEKLVSTKDTKISSLQFYLTGMEELYAGEKARAKRFERELILKNAELDSNEQELAEVQKGKEDLLKQIGEKNVHLQLRDEKYEKYREEEKGTIDLLLDEIAELKSKIEKGTCSQPHIIPCPSGYDAQTWAALPIEIQEEYSKLNPVEMKYEMKQSKRRKGEMGRLQDHLDPGEQKSHY